MVRSRIPRSASRDRVGQMSSWSCYEFNDRAPSPQDASHLSGPPGASRASLSLEMKHGSGRVLDGPCPIRVLSEANHPPYFPASLQIVQPLRNSGFRKRSASEVLVTLPVTGS